MRKILFILLFPTAMWAQLPFAETVLATDTNTLCPVLHGRICINDTFGVVFFEFGFHPDDTYDQTSGQHYVGSDTIFISIPITIFCDSTYYYYVAVLNQHASMIGSTLSFSAPPCGIGIEESSLDEALIIAPNPVIAVSKIRGPLYTIYEVYDLLGRKKNVVTIDGINYLFRKDFVPGLYLCRGVKNEQVVIKKFLVE